MRGGQPNRRAKDFSASNRRATDGRRIPPPLKLTMPLAPIAAKPRDHAVQQRIVAGTVDLGDRDPVLDAGKHCNLPIGNVAGEDDHPPTGRDRPIHMFEAASGGQGAHFGLRFLALCAT